MVVSEQGGRTVGSTPQFRSRPRPSDEEVLVPPPPAYDSPQRPGGWGENHFPELDAGGRFAGNGGGGYEDVMVLDNGELRPLGSGSVVDHAARTVSTLDFGAVVYGRTVALPLLTDTQLIKDGAVVFWKQYHKNGIPYGGEAVSGTGTLRIAARPYDPSLPPIITEQPFSAITNVPYIRLTGDYARHIGYEAEGGVLYARYNGFDGVERYRITQPSYTYPYNGRSDYLADIGSPRGGSQRALPEMPFSWRSPDSQVQISAGWRYDHALLDGEDEPVTLMAYGVTLWGGSWAAMCGPTNEEGEPEAWVLHEEGGTITRVTPDGASEQMPREQFEKEVLRVAPGRFQRFSAVGTLCNSWPPQWGLCECGEEDLAEVRAVGLHDPWRDSIKAKRPPNAQAPEWWYWPGRPKRRPRVLPASAPRAPLGLALADVFRATRGGGSGGTT